MGDLEIQDNITENENQNESESFKIVELFRYDPESNKAVCKITSDDSAECGQSIASNHHGNKMRHLKLKHSQIHSEVLKNSSKKRKHDYSNDIITIPVKINVQVVRHACVELVTKNGRPFCLFCDSGLRKLIDPLLIGIKRVTGQTMVINTENVKEDMFKTFSDMKKKLQLEVKDKIVTVLVDIGTKHNKSLLGINIRFHSGNRFILRTIGMETITTRHTAINLHQTISQCLSEFGIETKQVYVYVTDNAYNVVKIADLLNIDFENCSQNEENINDALFANMNQQVFHDLLSAVQVEYQKKCVHSVYCCIHTLQLAVEDAIKASKVSEELELVRRLVKKLRTPTISNELVQAKLKQAMLDCDTRWNYKYIMVITYLSK